MILALDTSASRTGYCVGPASGPVKTGSGTFGGYCGQIGLLLAAYRDWLVRTIEAHGVTQVIFEKPIRPFSAMNLLTLRQLYGIAGVVELICHDRDISCVEVDNQYAKKIFYGFGGKKPPKEVALRVAGEWGIEARNPDEADAAAVFIAGIHARYPGLFAQWERAKSDRLISAGRLLA